MSQTTLLKNYSGCQPPTSFTFAQQPLQNMEVDRAGLLRYTCASPAVFQAYTVMTAVFGECALIRRCACAATLVLSEQVRQLWSQKALVSKYSCLSMTVLKTQWCGKIPLWHRQLASGIAVCLVSNLMDGCSRPSYMNVQER